MILDALYTILEGKEGLIDFLSAYKYKRGERVTRSKKNAGVEPDALKTRSEDLPDSDAVEVRGEGEGK